MGKREVYHDAVLTIGRAPENILQIETPFISQFHGEISSKKKGFFSRRKLYYKDTSTNGTYYLPPGVFLPSSKYIKIHNVDVEILNGATLCFFSDRTHRKEQGIGVFVELK